MTRDMARSIRQVSLVTQDVTGSMQAVGDTASASGRSARDVPGAADGLSQETDVPKQARAFLPGIRAA